jgi:hypothetical protein
MLISMSIPLILKAPCPSTLETLLYPPRKDRGQTHSTQSGTPSRDERQHADNRQYPLPHFLSELAGSFDY